MSLEVDVFKYSDNRLMIVDWASLAYHQLWSMGSDKNREKYGLQNAEGELRIWKNKMVVYMRELIEMFNPKDIILAIEGKSWRKQFVKDYYNEHGKVYYDDKYIYTETDNYAYRVGKSIVNSVDEHGNPTEEVEYTAERIKPKDFSIFRSLPCKKLGELNPVKNSMLWNIFSGKNPIIPSYKGTRSKQDWDFMIDKAVWQHEKDEFGKAIAPYFRALAVQVDGAEGDDVIYNSITNLSSKYDSIVMVTRDSDMKQISDPKLTIYNHVMDEFIHCSNPSQYLAEKILCGDSSDNINGMALEDPKNPGCPKYSQVGEKGASALLESCANIYEKAKEEHWDKQYMRNKMLIDLSCTPQDIKDSIIAKLDVESVDAAPLDGMSQFGITERLIETCKKIQSRNFYAFQTRESIKNNPNMFANEKSAQAKRIAQINMDMAQPLGVTQQKSTVEQSRGFGDIGVFNDPLGGMSLF